MTLVFSDHECLDTSLQVLENVGNGLLGGILFLISTCMEL